MAQYNVGLLPNPTSITNYDNDITQNMLPNSPFMFFHDDNNSASPTDESSSSPYRLSSFDFSNSSQVDDVFGIQSSSDDNAYMVSEIRMNDPLSHQNLFTGHDNDSALLPTYIPSNSNNNTSTNPPQHTNAAENRLANNPRLLEINIYHKPRGCKGIWQPVDTGSALRVTKGKGKWLKLEIKSPVPIQAKDTQLTLMEDNVKDSKTLLDAHRVVSESLTIETISEYQKGGFWYVDAEIKVDTVSKRLQFHASASTPSGNVTGLSVPFSGHNNGKANVSKAKDSASDISTSPSSEGTPQVSRQSSTSDVFTSTEATFDTARQKRPSRAPTPVRLEESQPILGKRFKSENYPQAIPIPYEIPPEVFSQPAFTMPPSPESPPLKEYMVTQDTYPVRPPPMPQPSYPPHSVVIDTPHKSTNPATFQTDPPRVNMAFGQGPTTVLSGPLEVHGSVRATSFIQFSDLRLKADVQDLLGAVDIISQLEGKSYMWRPEETESLTGGRRVIGLIAQQVQRVLPEVVTEDPVTGYLSVSYTEIIPVLIEAFKSHMRTYQLDKQELHAQVNLLSSKMEELSANSKKAVPSRFDFRIETGDTDDLHTNPLASRLLANRPVLKQGTKCGSILGFTSGIIMVILGAITLGILLGRPAQEVQIYVEQANNLQPLDRFNSSANPDPFCQVRAGTAFFKTITVWNSRNPIWHQAFVATDETDFIPEINFEVMDDSKNLSEVAPRPMGYATFELGPGFPVHELVTRTLPLTVGTSGQIVQSEIVVSVAVKLRKRPDWEVALIVLGVAITSASAVLGSFVWITRPFPFLKRLYRGYLIQEEDLA